MSDALIVFEENDPLKASTTNDNNNFLLNKITTTAQTIEGEIDALETSLTSLINSSATPIGSVLMWTSPNIPTGWLAMVGQDISNSAYADLRTVIGTTTLPDTRNRVPQGNATPLQYIAAGLPNHRHWQSNFRDINGNFTAIGYGGWVFEGGTWTGWASDSNGIYGASDTVQPPAVTFVFIIKYQ